MSVDRGPRDAAAAFQQELSLNPNDFESNLYLGVILKEDREFAGARRYIDRAIVLRPDDPGARYQLATLLLASNEDGDRRRASAREDRRESPSFVEAHVSLATAYYRLKRKADGDRERAIVAKLTAEAQARQPGQTTPALPQE